MWAGITYRFPNLNGAIVEVCEWLCNFMLNLLKDFAFSLMNIEQDSLGGLQDDWSTWQTLIIWLLLRQWLSTIGRNAEQLC